MRSSKKVTEQKYFNVLKEIHSILKYNNSIALSSFCEEKGLNKVVVKVMREGGLIEKTGHGRGTLYKWITIEPNLDMARELSKRVNQARDSYRASGKEKNTRVKDVNQKMIFNHAEKKPTTIINKDIVEDILNLSKNGLSGREISKKLNISESSVFKYRKILDGEGYSDSNKESKIDYSETKLLWGLFTIKTKHYYK